MGEVLRMPNRPIKKRNVEYIRFSEKDWGNPESLAEGNYNDRIYSEARRLVMDWSMLNEKGFGEGEIEMALETEANKRTVGWADKLGSLEPGEEAEDVELELAKRLASYVEKILEETKREERIAA
jgi:hypothetical protein